MGEVTPASKAPKANSRNLRLLLDFILWKLLLSLGAPFQRFIFFNLYFCRSCWTLVAEVQRWLLWTIGWLSAPPSLPWLKHLGRGFLQTRRWHFGAAGLVVFALCRALFSKWREWTSVHYREVLRQQRNMKEATDFKTWAAACAKVEKLQGVDGPDGMARWKRETRLYDRKLLEERVQHLREVKRRGDVHEMTFAVRADLLRNLGNMCNSELHEAHSVVPLPIREYIKEVQSHLEYLTDYEGPELPLQEKLAFLRETRHAFGRTALVLSGGGALGAFHVGVVKALFQQDLLPRVISGSSVGSIVAATMATRNDEELRTLFEDAEGFDLSFFSNTTATQFFRHFLLKGTLQDVEVLQKRLRRLLGDATFLQAFMHSGRILNVAVCPADTNEPPRVLNYLTAPNVLVWSAVSCSSAFPFLFMPQDLLARDRMGRLVRFNAESVQKTERRWRDGSLEEDLPMRSLSEMFNVNYFLVSQTNPHIVPALNLKKRFNRKLGNVIETEWKHRCRQMMAIWPALQFLKVFSQPWEGDVTMVLPSSFMQIKKSITNPSTQDLKDACDQGERETWTKLSAIKANCGIELTIDACLASLTAKLSDGKKPPEGVQRSSFRRASGGGNPSSRSLLRARSPSWINLTAYGMPNVPSDEQLEKHDSGSLDSPRASSASSRPVLSDLRGMVKVLSVSALSDHMKAPGMNLLSSVREVESSADSSPGPSSTRDEAESPPSEEALPPFEEDSCYRSSLDGSDSDTSPSLYAGLPPKPGTDQMASAGSLLESLHSPDPQCYSQQAPSSMTAFDCCDRSVNVWETLIPLAVSSVGGQSLDVIAP